MAEMPTKWAPISDNVVIMTKSWWQSKRRRTDGAIKRGGELAKDGAVVETMQAATDLRFDLPAIGPRTIEVMASVNATVLAVEAGRTVMPDRDLLWKGRQAGIAVSGSKILNRSKRK
jgi:DUF1009 family protein